MNRSDSTLVLQQTESNVKSTTALDQPDCLPADKESLAPAKSAAVSQELATGAMATRFESSTSTVAPNQACCSPCNGKDDQVQRLPFAQRWTCGRPWRRRGGWSRWLADDIPVHHAVPNLILQAFATGVLDATTYADYRTFASNQTGNTILLAVSVMGTTEVLIVLTAISLGTFLLSACIFGHMGHLMGPRRRSWLLLSNTAQLIALLLALLFLTIGPAVLHVGGSHEWLVLALFAGMSGAQVASARQSGSAELPTAPMTSSYVDLVADRYLFVGFTHPHAGGRNRRLIYIMVMWMGAILGAVVHKYGGSAEVVALTMALKAVGMSLISVAQGEDGRQRMEQKEVKEKVEGQGQGAEERA